MKQLINLAVVLALTTAASAQTQRIVFQAPVLYPEGVTYDAASKKFFVGSVKTGTIGSVDENGTYKELYKDPSLKSSYGMKVDAKNNRLLVCISDANYSMYSTPATFKKMARLIAVDLTTGAKRLDVNLALTPGKHFANDMALDDAGNVYVTDSYSPNVYKVDASGKASVFATSPLFKSEDVGLNGILYSPQGYLLVAHSTNGSLHKIDLRNPKNVTTVKMKMLFPAADGMAWLSPNMLTLVQNKGANKLYQISSPDNWATAEVKGATATEDRFQHPTTVAVKDGQAWAVNAKFNELTDSSTGPSKEFSLQLAAFRPMQ